MGVVLLLLFPGLLLSVGPEELELQFVTVATVTIFRDLGLLALVLYLIWRNGEGTAALGWRRAGAWREAGLGLALFPLFFLGAAAVSLLLRALGFPTLEEAPSFLVPAGKLEVLLALVLLAVVAVTEETLFRGYLLLRLIDLFGNRGVAVVAAAAIFALGHGYQMAGGMIGVAVLGLVFALIYLWRGSLVAPAAIHFLQDFTALIILPLVADAG